MQCYDQYLLKNLRKAAEARGHAFWARGPDNAGSYNSQPHETGFFCEGGDYDGYYGRFFLNWYSQVLVDHGDRVLSLAKLAFEGTSIAAKVSQLFRDESSNLDIKVANIEVFFSSFSVFTSIQMMWMM